MLVALHGDVNLVAVDLHVPGDHREDLLAKHGDQIGTGRGAFVGEKDLQALARGRCRLLFAEQAENAHAALRAKILPKSPRFSPGISMGTSSPQSLRAASK